MRLGELPDLNAIFCAALDISAVELLSATAAHKRPYTVFQLLEGVWNAARPAGGAQNALHGLTRGFAVLGCGIRCRRAVIGRAWPGKNFPPIPDFSNFLGIVSLP